MMVGDKQFTHASGMKLTGKTKVYEVPHPDVFQCKRAFIGFAGIGDQETDSTGYSTIFAVGSFLFIITFILNIISIRVVRRFREVYE